MIVESTNVQNMHQSPAFAKPMLPAVFLVLDLEASPNDVVWSVNTTMEKAIESQKGLNDMRVGGAVTKIIEEKVN
jgi:hypothetical protein